MSTVSESTKSKRRISAETAAVASAVEALEARFLMSVSLPGATDCSLAFDTSGVLHAAYFDSSTLTLMYSVETSTGNWSSPTVITSLSGDPGDQISLGVSPKGNIDVSYRDPSRQELCFGQLVGSSWQISVVDGKGNTGLNPSLDFLKDGTPVISSYNLTKGRIEISEQAKSGWHSKFVGTGTSDESALAVNPVTKTPELVYQNTAGRVFLANVSKTGLASSRILNASRKQSSAISLAFSAGGLPTVAYINTAAGNIDLTSVNAKRKLVTVAAVNAPANSAQALTIVSSSTSAAPSVVYYDSASQSLVEATPSTGGTYATYALAYGVTGVGDVAESAGGAVAYATLSASAVGGAAGITVNNTRSTPAPPSDVNATANSATQITVSWSDPTHDASAFEIYRSIDGVDFVPVASEPSTTSSYADGGLSSGTTYYYEVWAIGTDGSQSLGKAATTAKGSSNVTVQATTAPGGEVSGNVFLDTNDTGNYVAGDAGVATLVTLTGETGGGNAITPITTTSDPVTGAFVFKDLTPGTYSLKETNPSGYLSGLQNTGGVISDILVTSGVNASGDNFAELLPATIRGEVYVDSGGIGVFTAGDTGVTSATLTLNGTDDLGDNIHQTKTSGTEGSYRFSGLRPGTYSVTVAAPAPYIAGLENSSGTISGLLLGSGGASTADNFGEVLPGSVSGRVYVDANDAGTYEGGDAGVTGVTVSLTGIDLHGHTVNLSQLTPGDGSYSFPDLAPGAYGVSIGSLGTSLLPGLEHSGGTIPSLTLSSGTTLSSENFSAIAPAVISGFVYDDSGNIGSYQSSDPGVSLVEITLTGIDDRTQPVTQTTTTAFDGSYSFGSLRPGIYSISHAALNGYLAGTDHPLGVISGITLTPGENDQQGNNFGLTIPLGRTTISGRIYVDSPNAGTFVQGDTGAAGLTVTLTGTDTYGNQVGASAVTGTDGTYTFTNILPGTYSLSETLTAAYTEGKENTIGTITGMSVTEGTPVTGQNFGVLLTAGITGTVYVDGDDSGQLKSGDNGIASVTVSLSGTDVLGRTVHLNQSTGVAGSYSFGQLTPGTYAVSVVSLNGYLPDNENLAGVISGLIPPPGTALTGENFGELIPAGITGIVYVDAGDQGGYQTGDSAVPGITVSLSGTNDLGATVSATATTSSSGAYSYSNLRPGTYLITRGSPAGYFSAADHPSGSISGITLASGQMLQTGTNFGLVAPAAIGGYLYIDAGDSGTYQAGDGGIGGVTISLNGSTLTGNSVSLTTTTANNGSYLFATLTPGTYTMSETLPSGYVYGLDHPAGVISNVTVVSGQDLASENFGAQAMASIGGVVYNDLSGAGSYMAGDTGISGVTVTLTGTDDLNHQVNQTFTTSSNGSYDFTGLTPGTYSVARSLPSGYASAADHASGSISGILISSGENLQTGENFGLVSSVTVSGVVYIDANDTGAYQSGDLGVAGITIRLSGTTFAGASVNLSTTTASDGSYAFTTVAPGNNYTIAESLTGQYLQGKDHLNGSIGGVVVTFGLPVTGENFGTLMPASIAGEVYVDATSSGSYQAGDGGLAAVLTLTGTSDVGGPVNISTSSTAGGSYSFTGLRPGNYQVSRGVVNGYVPAEDHTSGAVTGIVLTPGQTLAQGTNFGMVAPVMIGGYLYVDGSDSGIYQAGDVGVGGVTITLAGSTLTGTTVNLTTTTASNGSYTFALVTPGGYTVSETLPSNYVPGKQNPTGAVSGLNVLSGQDLASENFGALAIASIGGVVYNDLTSAGSHQSGDPGISGVTVTLTGTDDLNQTVNQTITTSSSGSYDFTDLTPGSYSVIRSSPAGYVSAADHQSGSISSVLLSSGENLQTGENFGLVAPTSISGSVYLDSSDTGSYQSGDSGVGGITVNLSGFTLLNNPVNISATTAADGSYSFTNVIPGSYTITESLTSSYLPGKNNSNGTISGLSILSGTPASGERLGVVTPASIGGIVYVDASGAGSYQSGDAGVPGVEITLTGTDDTHSQVTDTATTDSNGDYTFNGLRPGTYTLSRGTANGYTAGADHASGLISGVVIIQGEALSQGTNFGEVAQNQTTYDSQNFDSVTAPAIPAGVNTYGTNVATSTTAAHSGRNSLLFGGSDGLEFAYNDNSAADSAWSGWFQPNETSTPTFFDPLVILRAQSAPDSANLLPNGYAAVIGIGTQDNAIRISAISGGYENSLVSVSPTNRTTLFDSSHWYKVTFTAVDPNSSSAAVMLMIQRDDGLYLTVSNNLGTWGAQPADLIDVSVPHSTYNYSSGFACYGGYCPPNASVFWDDISWVPTSSSIPTAAPSNLLATGGSRQISLSWTAAPGDVVLGYTYDVYRGTSSGSESVLYTNVTTTSVTDSGLLDGTTYYYRIASVGPSGPGPLSAEASAVTNPFVTGSGATLSGYVYDDLNSVGSYQVGDVGLVGATVTLSGNGSASQPVAETATTDGNGFYSFAGLEPGNYNLAVTVSTGYTSETANLGTTGGTAATGLISNISVPADADSIGNDFGELFSSSNDQYLLTPSLLASLRAKAVANTPQWQAFNAKLNSALDVVILSDYQGDQLPWISNYALGYQVLQNIDPTTAREYADKAAALLYSSLHDTEKGLWGGDMFLSVADGSTTEFTLPNNDVNSSSLRVFLSPTYVKAMTKGAVNGQDQADPFAQPIAISNSPGGPSNYTEGVDWQINGNYADGTIDWALGSRNQPATGSTYYITEATASETDALSGGYSLQGNTLTFNSTPAAGTAIFVQYIYGKAGDSDGGAYQQTSDGRGGYNAVLYDNGFAARYFQDIAAGLDWLWNYPGLSSSLRTDTENTLVQWFDYLETNGYNEYSAASNYGDGQYNSQVAIALALQGRIAPATEENLKSWVVNWYNTALVPTLSPALDNGVGTLYGGHWAEGWTYAEGSIDNVITAGTSLANAGWINNGPEQLWANQCISDILSEQPTQTTIYDGGDNYGYPVALPESDTLETLASAASNASLVADINYSAENYSTIDSDFTDFIFRDPSAPATNPAEQLPLQYLATGTGFLSARQDWSYNSTWFTFQVGNPLACDHQTYAQGQMTIDDGENALLILPESAGDAHDRLKASVGNEVVISDNGAGEQLYAGTQAYSYGPVGCAMTAYQGTGNYVYASGDYTNAYGNPNNTPYTTSDTLCTRSVFYLRDTDSFVVYDRADTTDPTYTKQLQWWFLNSPTVSSQGSWSTAVSNLSGVVVDGSGIPETERPEVYLTGTSDQGNPVSDSVQTDSNGKFSFSNLEPGNYTETATYGTVEITSQGGARLFGQEYSTTPLAITNTQQQVGDGTFARLAVNPASPTSDVRYITVMQTAGLSQTQEVSSGQIVSAEGKLQGSQVGNDVVMFGVDPDVTGNASYSVTAPLGQMLTHYVTDLSPGTVYQIGGANQGSAVVSSQGVLTFTTAGTGNAQTVTLSAGNGG